MFTEAQCLPISALQHMVFCPRQCALIHLERQWSENKLTVQGQHLHQRAHDPKRTETRPGIRIVRSLAVCSLRLGISGVCDVVEFPDVTGLPIVIEYKRGKPKTNDADIVQVAAQAMCLEEMLKLDVAKGQVAEIRLFYGKTRRRLEVSLDDAVRQRVQQVAGELHDMFDSRVTPKMSYDKARCERCSLLNLCQPELFKPRRQTSTRFAAILQDSMTDEHLIGEDAI
jgi:CRISPR-associated exonuclease Cas4